MISILLCFQRALATRPLESQKAPLVAVRGGSEHIQSVTSSNFKSDVGEIRGLCVLVRVSNHSFQTFQSLL